MNFMEKYYTQYSIVSYFFLFQVKFTHKLALKVPIEGKPKYLLQLLEILFLHPK